jgi:single-stranded-DNA-specific exonuclease
VIAYQQPAPTAPHQIWEQLAGIAKYLSRTHQTVTRQQLLDRLGISDRPLQLGFRALQSLGFTIQTQERDLAIDWQPATPAKTDAVAEMVNRFLAAIQEEQFRRQYFYQVPLARIQAIMAQIHSEYSTRPGEESV